MTARRALGLAVAGLALVVAAVLQGPARADDGKLTLEIRRYADDLPGKVVHVDGQGFPENATDVEVTFGDKKAPILATSATRITFQVPDVSPGAYTVHVRTKNGPSYSASFEVLDKTKREVAERVAARDAGNESAGYRNPHADGDLRRKLLSIEKVTLTAGAAPSCVVEGETALPRHFKFDVELGYLGPQGEARIDRKPVTVRGKTWTVAFGPYEGKVLLTGKYYASAQFELAAQGVLTLHEAGWDRLAKADRELRETLHHEKVVDSGTPEDAARQLAELRAHYLELARKTTEAVDALERAYAAAGKSYCVKATGALDSEAWRKWIAGRGVGTTEDERKRLEADARFLRGTRFNPDAWQEWVASELYRSLRAVAESHRAFKTRYLGSRDRDAEGRGEALVATVVRLAQHDSREIYERNKLSVPAAITAPPGLDLPADAGDPSRALYESRRRALLERFGLDAK